MLVRGHSSVMQCNGGWVVYGSVQMTITKVYGPTLLALLGGAVGSVQL